MDDADLLRAYFEGHSEDAFAKLIERYLKLVYFTAIRQVRGNAHLAEDVTQLVFTRLARKGRTLLRRPSIAGWLYVTAKLMAWEVTRAERRRLARESKAHLMNELQGLSEPPIDWERLSPVIDEVLDALPERDREIILLRFFHGSPFADIGATFGLSMDAARLRADRALERMRRALLRRGVSGSTVILAATLAGQAEAAVPTGVASIGTGNTLAAAGAAVSGGAGLFTALGLLSLTALAGAAYEFNDAARTRAMLAEASRQNDAQTETFRGWDREARTLAAEQHTLQKEIKVSSAAPAAPGADRRAPSPSAEARLFFARFPEARALVAHTVRVQNGISFLPFYTAAHLSPAQIQQLSQLFREAAINLAAELSGNKFVLNIHGQDLKDPQLQGRLRDLLGSDAYAQYLEYMRQAPIDAAVEQIGAMANYSGEPLSSDQRHQLLTIEKETDGANPAGGAPLFAQVQAALTPRQWKTSEEALLRQQFLSAYREAR